MKGYNILFLGSSVTYGTASRGYSFADCISERNGANMYKEAVGGTTLTDEKNSYIERLEKIDKNIKFDLAICQLSTNDATRKKPLGEVSRTTLPDRSTVCGAIEHIINYIRAVWGCPIVFYTNSYYENAYYAKMVDAMKKIASLYGVGLINLYEDESFNEITAEQRTIYMADDIHPTKSGYTEWWTPKMEEYLYNYFKKTV
jgi:lysophospholipase L1-like esterase